MFSSVCAALSDTGANMWEILLLAFIGSACLLYYATVRNFEYWKKKKVPYPQPVPFLGNYGDFILLKTFIGNVTRNIYQQFPDEPYVGVYYGTEPTLLVQDPEILKLIFTKDFYYFNGREASNYAEKEVVTKGVFFNHSDQWKVIRQTLTPLFSTAKMKNMFPLIEKCTVDFEKTLEYETGISKIIEMNNLMSRFTMDCVGSCAFGVEINLLHQDYKNNPYKKLGDSIFESSSFRGYSNIGRAIWPWFFYALGFKMFPSHVSRAMDTLFTNICNFRNNKPSPRNDFVDLLLSLKTNEYMVADSMKKSADNETKKVYRKLDKETMIAMCLAFFGGGFETTATTLVMTLFEIAKNEEVQSKVQQEVDDYLNKRNSMIAYDCVTELPYLSACVDETLRLYPLFPIITREVMEDYTLPTGVTLDKGVRIHIPVYHIHHDPGNFPEPDLFRPERFFPEEKPKIKPYTYLPFGEGPRICIGMRFSRMEVFSGIITILKNYNLKLAEGMSTTLDFDPRVMVTHTLNDVYIEFQRR